MNAGKFTNTLQDEKSPSIELTGITKTFPGVRALSEVCLKL